MELQDFEFAPRMILEMDHRIIINEAIADIQFLQVGPIRLDQHF